MNRSENYKQRIKINKIISQTIKSQSQNKKKEKKYGDKKEKRDINFNIN